MLSTRARIETAQQRVSSPVNNNTQCSSGDAPSGFILKLFQMVNGAPDEVIAWTASGDAFIIGSDLKRLESDTLPQYFRHNRFQSLVRQLNFYSFRKINRERNTWIYQHHLFHRDRPEDLHLVRRRTCPGPDGRKQRFSARKLNQRQSENEIKSDDESSLETTTYNSFGEETFKKRELERFENSTRVPSGKRSRRISMEPEYHTSAKKNLDQAIVDTSMLIETAQANDKEQSDDEASLSLAKYSGCKIEMAEQSMVVSEVAMKLDQLNRKAMKGRSGASGIVTPPTRSYVSPAHSGSLLTYDDEYEYSDHHKTPRRSSTSSLGVVTDSDDSSSSCIGLECTSVSPIKPKQIFSPPVEDNIMVQETSKRVILLSSNQSLVSSMAPHTVAIFCMSTSPYAESDKVLCSKILELISSCDQLASEFNLYRSALHPSNLGETSSSGFSPQNLYGSRPVTVQQIWQREGSRCEAVRDFKTFAVNSIHKILRASEEDDRFLKDSDKIALERTADIWLKSVGTM